MSTYAEPCEVCWRIVTVTDPDAVVLCRECAEAEW